MIFIIGLNDSVKLLVDSCMFFHMPFSSIKLSKLGQAPYWHTGNSKGHIITASIHCSLLLPITLVFQIQNIDKDFFYYLILIIVQEECTLQLMLIPTSLIFLIKKIKFGLSEKSVPII